MKPDNRGVLRMANSWKTNNQTIIFQTKADQSKSPKGRITCLGVLEDHIDRSIRSGPSGSILLFTAGRLGQTAGPSECPPQQGACG